MKSEALFLAVGLFLLLAKPMWAQQIPDRNLMVQLEQKLAQSDSEAKNLTGGPKEVWLLRKLEIEEAINQVKAGQSVDPKKIDEILSGRVNY